MVPAVTLVHSSEMRVSLELVFFHFPNPLGERGNYVEKIANDSVVGDIEDGRVGVLIHGDNATGVLDAYDVLDSAGNSRRDVEFR